MKSPFPFETIALKKSFYGRKEEIKTLKSFVKNSSNVLLFSKRRMGKTALIKNLFDKIKDDFTVIYIDIYNIITAQDFGKILLKGITDNEKGDVLKTIKKLASIFKRIKIEPTFNPETSRMGIKTFVGDLNFDELMEDSFNVLFEMAKEKDVVLAIDEFQQIANIKDVKIDAILRKYMQEGNNISYIFLGSKRNLLNSLFAYKAPLYSMATPMSLKPLKVKDIYEYAKKHLSISKEVTQYIFDTSKGETKLIQTILHRLYIDNKRFSYIDKKGVDEVIGEILISKDDQYKTIFEILSKNQKKAFKLLAKHNKDLFSKAVLYEENISRSSMQSSLKQLFEKEYIDKDDGVYFIPDRTFELWAKRYL